MPATLLQMTYDRDLRQTDDAISLRNIRDHTPTELVREMAQRLLAAGGYWAVGEFDTEDEPEWPSIAVLVETASSGRQASWRWHRIWRLRLSGQLHGRYRRHRRALPYRGDVRFRGHW
jgi:hypothetical protein